MTLHDRFVGMLAMAATICAVLALTEWLTYGPGVALYAGAAVVIGVIAYLKGNE